MGFLVEVSPRWPHRLQRTNRTTPRAPKAPMYPSAETTISNNTTRTATKTSNDTIFHLPLSPHDCIVLRFPSARQVPIGTRLCLTALSTFQGAPTPSRVDPATPTSLRDLDWLPARLAPSDGSSVLSDWGYFTVRNWGERVVLPHRATRYRESMKLSDDDYAHLLELRTSLRRFERWSERQAHDAGLTPAQHQLLLAIRGHADPSGPTVSDIADYLLVAPSQRRRTHRSSGCSGARRTHARQGRPSARTPDSHQGRSQTSGGVISPSSPRTRKARSAIAGGISRSRKDLNRPPILLTVMGWWAESWHCGSSTLPIGSDICGDDRRPHG